MKNMNGMKPILVERISNIRNTLTRSRLTVDEYTAGYRQLPSGYKEVDYRNLRNLTDDDILMPVLVRGNLVVKSSANDLTLETARYATISCALSIQMKSERKSNANHTRYIILNVPCQFSNTLFLIIIASSS